MHMSAFSAHMSVSHMHDLCSQKVEEGIEYSGTESEMVMSTAWVFGPN